MTNQITDTIIENINTYIKQQGIKQKWIADTMGINEMVLSKILNQKKKNISFEEIMNLLQALDLELTDVQTKGALPLRNGKDQAEENTAVYFAMCGEIKSPQTQKSLALIGDIIDIYDNLIEANQSDSYLEYI